MSFEIWIFRNSQTDCDDDRRILVINLPMTSIDAQKRPLSERILYIGTSRIIENQIIISDRIIESNSDRYSWICFVLHNSEVMCFILPDI